MAKRYFLVILAGGLIAFAASYGVRNYYGAKPSGLIKELGLDSGQREKYNALINQLQAYHEDVCARLCRQREELITLLSTTPLQKDKIEEKLQKINYYQGEVERATVAHVMEIQGILTVSQKEKYLAHLNKKMCEFNAESVGFRHHQQMRCK